MTIQQYSELIAQVAKIESKKAHIKELKEKERASNEEFNKAYADKYDIVELNACRDRWLDDYDEYEKEEKSLKRMLRAFRAKLDKDEFSYLTREFRYSEDKSDRNFYWSVRYSILREANHIEFTTGR